MKLTGPRRRAAAVEQLVRWSGCCDRLMPEPEPPLKMMPSSRYQLRIESIVSSTARMKHAARLLGHALDADVEPHRAVERGPLGDEDVLQLGVERLGLVVVDEVAALDAPRGDRVDDAVDRPGAATTRARACRACRGSTSGRRCWWRSATSRPGTRRRAARRRPCRPSSCVMRASRRSHTTSSYGSTPGDVNSRPRPIRPFGDRTTRTIRGGQSI